MNFISLFSGAMGLDLGLEESGFKPIICVENNKAAVKTIRVNRPDIKVFDKSITDFGIQNIRDFGVSENDIDLIAGGPPCQAFSVFGKRLGVEDVRGQMTFEFLRVVNDVKPKVFLMENVRGILSVPLVPKKNASKDIDKLFLEKGSLLKYLIKDFNKIGYHVDCYVVNVVNYGAPQVRERVLLIGNKFGCKSDFPKPIYSNRPIDNLPKFKTLGDVIGPESGFKDPYPQVLNFSPRKLKYLAMIPEGGNWRSLPIPIQKESMGKSWYLKGGRSAYWRKLSFDFPSPTVVTMPNHAGTSMCHPTELRAITVGEAAAIQEFPINWEFQGTTSEKFKQIGNAVPVRLGRIAGKVIKELLKKSKHLKPNLKVKQDFVITKVRPHVRTRTFWKDGKAFSGNTSYYSSSDKRSTNSIQLEIPFNSDVT